MSVTELQGRQKAQGAILMEEMPADPLFAPPGSSAEVVHFGDPRQEWEQAQSSAVVFDLSHRGHLQMTGAQRQKFLNGFCTADVANLKPGEGCEAFVTNIKGKILGHVFLFAEEDALWLETVADAVRPLIDHLSRYVITEDVEFAPQSEAVGELLLHGPQASDKLQELGVDVSDLPIYGHRQVEIQNISVHISRVDWLGGPGFLLRTRREELPAVWDHLAASGISPAGMAVFHALRIAAGFPLYGIDISDDNLAQEAARTEQAINFKKGCYLGQEPIARIDALGHVNRELRSLQWDAKERPAPGSTLRDSQGKEVGRITSWARHPEGDTTLAMALLRREYLKPGTEVLVASGEQDLPVRVL